MDLHSCRGKARNAARVGLPPGNALGHRTRQRFFLSGGPNEPDPPTPSWLSAILHQLVVIAAIFVQITAEKWTDEERTAVYRYWHQSQDVMREQVVRLVLPTHPRQAADFLKWMRSERSEGEEGGTSRAVNGGEWS